MGEWLQSPPPPTVRRRPPPISHHVFLRQKFLNLRSFKYFPLCNIKTGLRHFLRGSKTSSHLRKHLSWRGLVTKCHQRSESTEGGAEKSQLQKLIKERRQRTMEESTLDPEEVNYELWNFFVVSDYWHPMVWVLFLETRQNFEDSLKLQFVAYFCCSIMKTRWASPPLAVQR